jgi:hypothetical protein
MILRFAVENHRSLRDRVELSFVATRLQDAPAWRPRGPSDPAGPLPGCPHGVLPVVGVFGANASGKSNLLGALKRMRSHVLRSFQLGPTEPPPHDPFALRADDPTTFELDLLVDGVRHHYGFRVDARGFREEWLYRWPGRSRQLLFHRDAAAEPAFHLGAALGRARRFAAEATRPNTLLLSTGAQLNQAVLLSVATAITDGIAVEGHLDLQGLPLFVKDAPLLQDQHRLMIRAALRAADLGVVDVEPRAFRLPEGADLPPPFPSAGRDDGASGAAEARPWQEVLRMLRSGDLRELWLHRRAGDQPWTLPPAQESRGTLALLVRLNDLLPVLTHGRTLVVDELDTSLHPDLCALLVRLFTDPATNPRGAQLLFTTHDRGLLQALRRDEVLLVDKSPEGVSTARAASDFAGVRQRDDLRRLHEQGQLGGVPAFGAFNHAFEGAGR